MTGVDWSSQEMLIRCMRISKVKLGKEKRRERERVKGGLTPFRSGERLVDVHHSKTYGVPLIA